ncbi:splicing regulatory protein 54 isoform X7 [Oratosquilla oratoria]|uniref:splicing regulatory protein 54 isoform X7 n=1 Tax=Oratosquilla oratoria TaxID=337810 RepID=UPI003F769C52
MTRIVQISNIAPQATKDQMSTLFGFLGKIEDIRLYPTIRDVAIPVQSRICFIKFHDRDCVGVAQHLTNTVFIDRALIVVPHTPGEMPDEHRGMEILASGGAIPGLGQEAKWPPHVNNQIEGIILRTDDPKLAEHDLPDYPPLPATTESHKVNEIRRTVVFDNLESNVTADQVMSLAAKAGEVRYLRLGTEKESSRNALVEYSEQPSVVNALQLHHHDFGGRQIKVNHSTVAIIKPQTKSNEAAQREIEEAMRRVKEAQNYIASAIDPVMSLLDSTATKDPKRSRSRSRERRRRSRSRSRRHRSRSRSRRSRSRRRSRSKSRSRRSTSKAKTSSSSSKKDKDRDKDKEKSKSSSSRDKDKDRDKDRKDKKDSDKDKKKMEAIKENEKMKDSESADKDEKESKGKESPKPSSKSKGRSKSRSKSKGRGSRRSRSPSRPRRSRSRSRSRSRGKSRRTKRSSRSRSRRRSRTRSRSRDRRRSRSRDRRRSRSPARKGSSKDGSSHKKLYEGSHVSRRKESRRDRSRSRDRKDKGRDKDKHKEKHKEKKKEKKDKEEKTKKDSKQVLRDYDEEEQGYEGEAAEKAKANKFEQEEIKDTAGEAVDMDISDSP